MNIGGTGSLEKHNTNSGNADDASTRPVMITSGTTSTTRDEGNSGNAVDASTQQRMNISSTWIDW